MWLLPFFSQAAAVAVRTFYRFSVEGERVPGRGPVLLVANHPNSLMDPGVVATVARRPVRFLAKAPLFTDRQVGWLIRASGSIPVFRKSDDPTVMGQNQDTFRAVFDALADRSAVGIFPEGTSHSAPALVPLKTGAARMALGGAGLIGRDFPIVPVGLCFADKGRFRSEALALVGDPVAWSDLARGSPDDPATVRELTARIDDALQRVTVNLERWEDAGLVDAAERIYAAEYPDDASDQARVARKREITEALRRLRHDAQPVWMELAGDVTAHDRLLRTLGLRPHELHATTDSRAAAAWTVRKLARAVVEIPLAALGILVYFIPYRLTGIAEARARPEPDVRATYKVLFGGALHLVWTLLLVALVAWIGGWAWAVGALLILPLLGVATLGVLERWSSARGELHRFLVRARRRERLQALRERQREIAGRLRSAWESARSAQRAGEALRP